MTSTSARETTRSSRRPRPQMSGKVAPVAPPVLFRLPSISLGNATIEHIADASLAASISASPQSVPATFPDATQNMPGTNSNASTEKMAGTKLETAGDTHKSRGQRMLNTLIVLLLLLAVVVITWVSIMQPHRTPEIAGEANKSDPSLDSLSELRVPDVSIGSPAQPKNEPKDSIASGASQSIEPSKADALIDHPKSSIASDLDKEAGSLISGLDLSGSSDTSASQPVGDAPSLATKPATEQSPTASVQLGMPVPMTPPPSLANQNRSNTSSGSSLPLTTPRYETVSNASPAKSVFDKAPSDATATTTAKPDTATPASADPNGSKGSGGSPSLWEGARTSAVPESNSGGLTISKPMSAEISMTPAAKSGTENASSPTANTAPASELSSSLLLGQNSTAKPTNDAANRGAVSPGVTVGGGFKEPGNLSETQTPNMDVAQLSQRYVEYSKQKSLTGGSSPAVNSYQPAAQPTRQNMPTGPNSYTQNYANTAPAYPSMPQGGPINSYAQQLPGGVTGSPTTPYVRNAPASMPQAPVASMAAGPTAPNASLPSYQSVPANQNGYAIPARTAGQNPAVAPSMPANPNMNSGVMSGGYGYGAAPGSGYPNTAYPTPQSGQSNFNQSNFNQPAYNQPTYNAPNYQQPGFGQPNNMQPSMTPPQGGASFGIPPNMQSGMQPGAQPYGAQPSMNGSPAAAAQRGVTYPTTNMNPNVQAPVGLIGQTGYATAPTGDFAPAIPVTGTIGAGSTSASNLGLLPPAGSAPMQSGQVQQVRP